MIKEWMVKVGGLGSILHSDLPKGFRQETHGRRPTKKPENYEESAGGGNPVSVKRIEPSIQETKGNEGRNVRCE